MFGSGGWNDALGDARAEAVIIEYEGVVNECIEDLDGDGVVGGADLTLLLSSWNTQGTGDINGDGNTDGADLTLLLSKWGLCS